MPAPTTRRLSRTALIATTALCAALPACGRMFTVEVHNDSSRRVIASIHADRIGGERDPMDQRTIAPGDVAVLGPEKAPSLEFVELSITPGGGIAEQPITQRLSQGRSTAYIEDARQTEFGVVRVRVTQDD